MKKITVKYNPYSITTVFTIDGEQLKQDSCLHVGNSRLQECEAMGLFSQKVS